MKEYKNLEIKAVKWFTGRDSIGIITCVDKISGEKKCYMGVASGLGSDYDIKHIIDWGQKLSGRRLNEIVKFMK